MKKTNSDLSFSTSWNWRDCHKYGLSGADLMHQIIDLGFNKVELNYRITSDMLKTIEPMVFDGEIEVPSVHNVFPYVEDVDYDTDSLLLGYEDDEKRKNSIALTKRTVDYAHRLGSKVVVIHPGAVPLPENKHYDRILKTFYDTEGKDSQVFKMAFDNMITYRQEHSMDNMKRIRNSLEDISEYILKKGYDVKLGIENRAMCHQLPDFTEINWLLDELPDSPVYFWYDVGHGIMMDSLGMFNNKEEVYKIQDKIIGVHIHDALGVDDHFSPYTKSEILDDFLPLFENIDIKVMELGCKNSIEDIKKGMTIFNERRSQLI